MRSLVLVLACGSKESGAPAVDPAAWAVGERGPFQAGYRSWDVTYVDALGVSRTVPVGVWYPTEDTEGGEVVWLGAFHAEDALGDAAPAAAVHPAGYPVMAYSHGWQGWGATSHDLMAWFASHGWVAVAPDHVGNTLLDTPDPLPTVHYLHRPTDLSAALDALAELPADDPLSAADVSRVFLTGHSFGSYTTWAAAGAAYDATAVAVHCPELPEGGCTPAEEAAFQSGLNDARGVAAMPMAGNLDRGFFGDQGHAAVDGPFLFQTGSQDDVGLAEQFDTYTGVDRRWVEIAGGCHQAFALGGCAELETEEGWRIVDTYALAFARRYVLGDEGAEVVGVLDGSVTVSPLVTLRSATD